MNKSTSGYLVSLALKQSCAVGSKVFPGLLSWWTYVSCSWGDAKAICRLSQMSVPVCSPYPC